MLKLVKKDKKVYIVYSPNHLNAPLLTGPASAVTLRISIPEHSHLQIISSISSAIGLESIADGVKWNPTTCLILGPPMLAIRLKEQI